MKDCCRKRSTIGADEPHSFGRDRLASLGEPSHRMPRSGMKNKYAVEMSQAPALPAPADYRKPGGHPELVAKAYMQCCYGSLMLGDAPARRQRRSMPEPAETSSDEPSIASCESDDLLDGPSSRLQAQMSLPGPLLSKKCLVCRPQSAAARPASPFCAQEDYWKM